MKTIKLKQNGKKGFRVSVAEFAKKKPEPERKTLRIAFLGVAAAITTTLSACGSAEKPKTCNPEDVQTVQETLEDGSVAYTITFCDEKKIYFVVPPQRMPSEVSAPTETTPPVEDASTEVTVEVGDGNPNYEGSITSVDMYTTNPQEILSVGDVYSPGVSVQVQFTDIHANGEEAIFALIDPATEEKLDEKHGVPGTFVLAALGNETIAFLIEDVAAGYTLGAKNVIIRQVDPKNVPPEARKVWLTEDERRKVVNIGESIQMGQGYRLELTDIANPAGGVKAVVSLYDPAGNKVYMANAPEGATIYVREGNRVVGSADVESVNPGRTLSTKSATFIVN